MGGVPGLPPPGLCREADLHPAGRGLTVPALPCSDYITVLKTGSTTAAPTLTTVGQSQPDANSKQELSVVVVVVVVVVVGVPSALDVLRSGSGPAFTQPNDQSDAPTQS